MEILLQDTTTKHQEALTYCIEDFQSLCVFLLAVQTLRYSLQLLGRVMPTKVDMIAHGDRLCMRDSKDHCVQSHAQIRDWKRRMLRLLSAGLQILSGVSVTDKLCT